MNVRERSDFDYVVVGSGAGGGPLAAGLARAGMRVLLLEAGGDGEGATYQVPSFHALASEDEDLRWDFFVRHYADDERQRRDSKFAPERDGVLYPRSGTLGGCTAHNAMITVYPHARDFDAIAQATGDRSWQSENMRRYFERLERCQYADRPRGLPRNPWLAALLRRLPLLARLFQGNGARHGFDGWLPTSLADPKVAIKDSQLVKVLLAAGKEVLAEGLGRPLELLEDLVLGDPESYVDPNDWRAAQHPLGAWFTPLATSGGRRSGTREYIRAVAKRHPDKLTVKTNALASRVVLDADGAAIGVEHLYRADPRADGAAREVPLRRVLANREVVLAAGAFNTPQILKLSGIGPREELARHGIEVRAELPGVGENLQDRYEVGVVSEMDADFGILEGCTFAPPDPAQPEDPCFRQWRAGEGVYTTNGAVLGIVLKSAPARADPDLFVFGLPAYFKGYYPGYSRELSRDKGIFTWAVLKAHTRNSAGSVTLRSADPRDVPQVTFRYFEEGNDADAEDLESVVEGVDFARRIMRRADGVTTRELIPGEGVASRDEVRQFVKDEAWGHHASCTCKIGPREDPMAVLDSDFRVHGVPGLRVVDASVFPYIPGFFIVTSVYMVSEKATDAILRDASPLALMRRRLGRPRGAIAEQEPPVDAALGRAPQREAVV